MVSIGPEGRELTEQSMSRLRFLVRGSGTILVGTFGTRHCFVTSKFESDQVLDVTGADAIGNHPEIQAYTSSLVEFCSLHRLYFTLMVSGTGNFMARISNYNQSFATSS